MSALSLFRSVGRPKVVSLMLYGSFRKSLDSLAALLWTPSIRTAMNKTEHGVRQVFGKLEVILKSNIQIFF